MEETLPSPSPATLSFTVKPPFSSNALTSLNIHPSQHVKGILPFFVPTCLQIASPPSDRLSAVGHGRKLRKGPPSPSLVPLCTKEEGGKEVKG